MKKHPTKSNSKKAKKLLLTGEKLGKWMSVPTIEARLKSAHTAVVLVNETIAGLAKSEDVDPFDDPIVVEAIATGLLKASEDLWWLSLLPKNVLDMPAPDDDQKDVMEGGKG
ncbi:MAG TPA: hypothetical protein VES67_06050 [Vicinamibacterales bacterium]|nr:hypothetical protein [Vicinamibacterales bacterium]